VTAAPVPASAPVGPFAIFRNRYFVYLWTGQLISTIGDALTSLAAGIIVFQVTHSILNVGIMLMVSSIPTLVFGLVAGVFVDRFDRKTIMVASVVIRAGLVAAIPLSLALTDDILWLYVIVLLSASVQQFFDPANDSVLPEIASDQELAAANSLMAIAQFGSTAIGFALAGLLIGTSRELVFWIDAATFLFSGLMISLVAVKPLEVEEETTVLDIVRNLGVGVRFILGSPVLRSATTLRAPVMVVIGLQNVLLLPFAIEVLKATPFEYGLQEGVTSVGFVIGSLLMARFAERIREGSWLVLSFLGMGIAGLLYALSSNIWMAIALIGVSGLLNAPSFVATRLINQRNTPRDMRGRVFSTIYVIREVVYLIGMGLAGLADIWDVRIMFALSSGLLILIALAGSRLPGIGQPAAEWGRTITLLRTAPKAPLGALRAVTPADIARDGEDRVDIFNLYLDRVTHDPEMDTDRARDELARITNGYAQPLDAELLTPSGWKRMGDVQRGDLLIGADGRPTQVVAVHPRGDMEVFKVTFNDGTSTECTADHLWTLEANDPRMRPRTLTLAQIVDRKLK